MTRACCIVTLLVGLAMGGACGPRDEEPALPGTATMELNADMVSQLYNGGAKTSALNSGGGLGGAFQYDHVTNAIARGSVAGAVIGTGAAPHVIAWGAALAAGFTWDGQAKLWRSTTSVTIYGKTYTLTAEAVLDPVTDKNSYKMLVDGKLLTTGSSDFYITAGSWQLHDPTRPGSPKVVEVTWDRSNPASRTVSGLVVDPTAKHVGTSASFSRAGSLRTLVVNVQPNNEAYFEIVVDLVSHQGSILAQGYNNGLKGCWDSSFKDTPCQ